MIEQLVAILVLVGFIGAVGCFVERIAKARCWSRCNKYTLLARCAERYRAIGP